MDRSHHSCDRREQAVMAARYEQSSQMAHASEGLRQLALHGTKMMTDRESSRSSGNEVTASRDCKN